MALFIVRHQHSADQCPAADPYVGAGLLNYLSRPNVRKLGVHIQGEAVVRGEHTMYLIVDAEDEQRVREFMQPFENAGSVAIYPASTCARVVASGGCSATMPINELAPAVDPEEACQQAIEAGLVVHRAHPLNSETSIPALVGSVVMPNAHFYVRNHFHIPQLETDTYRLSVSGAVDRSLNLSLRELRNMPSQTLVATLECAGNGRTLFEPPVPGEKWNLGAVSTAEWTGVPLVEVFDRAGLQSRALDVLFRGADGGEVEGCRGPIRFERSLSVADARQGGVLLAYAMNGEPLPLQHGYPLRVIVPDWYAVASVKWLTAIELLDRPFVGHYQTDKYQYEWVRNGHTVREPVTLQQVRALITEPAHGQQLPHGEVTVRGVAWSGAAPIARVEVSVSGARWQDARLIGERQRHRWQWWELITRTDTPGRLSVRARATDMAGRTQPEVAEWNRLGYGNNAIQEIVIDVS
jgi:DMSO/TMAO reductase YedYZ molybdopterin-dependent catalytic subunit